MPFKNQLHHYKRCVQCILDDYMPPAGFKSLSVHQEFHWSWTIQLPGMWCGDILNSQIKPNGMWCTRNLTSRPFILSGLAALEFRLKNLTTSSCMMNA